MDAAKKAGVKAVAYPGSVDAVKISGGKACPAT